MGRMRLFWYMFPSYLVITLIAIVAVIWTGSSVLPHFYEQQAKRDLEARARLVEPQLLRVFLSGDRAACEAACKDLGERSDTRFTLILPTGEVIGDSNEDPRRMKNHLERPEIAGALSTGNVVTAIHPSPTLGQTMVYVAVPLKDQDRLMGVLRAAIPLVRVQESLHIIRRELLLAGLVVALLTGLVCLFVTRRLTAPLDELRDGAQRAAEGDLSIHLTGSNMLELNALAEALNAMTDRLRDRIAVVSRQAEESEAILSSMSEGVLAVGPDESVINLNPAAARLLGAHVEHVQGRNLEEISRNPDFLAFVRGALETRKASEDELILHDTGKHYLRIQALPLSDLEGSRMGVLFVLNDLTALRQLELVRRDFVANVSHELMTPITLIKGFVETLQEGAADDREERARFLTIIARHTNRLEAIISDLLMLARLEQETEEHEFVFSKAPLRPILEAAVENCRYEIEQKGIRMELTCPINLQARMQPALIEHAVVNLLTNSIKYSEANTQVQLSAVEEENEVVIRVHDEGCGIPQAHLPRVFERFYRVDKARSRQVGGTGLGLAIVKHITLIHKGRVSVDSTVGVGSVFRIHLPFS
ncbi:MAG TPA: ATP-binding protein [Candidatus Sumerlaeota bacterium]|nr:ATP-binding protein [Candidatus Sumerlaeota bacterium]